jgi:hypothetical protein
VAKQDPTAGVSFWEKSRTGLPAENLNKDLRTEVMIVGAGITGSSHTR